MSNPTIHLLLIEDNPGDARMVKEALREDTSTIFNLVWVDSLAKGLDYLDANHIDAVLLDLSLPDSSGLATFEKVRVKAPRALIILLTGSDDQALAARVVQEGAQDYLIKGQVDHRFLVRSIRYALERGRLVDALLESEQKFRGLVENSIDGIVLVNEKGEIIEWNAGEERITGLKRADVIGRLLWEIMVQVLPENLKTPEFYEGLKGMFFQILKPGQNPPLSQVWETDIQRTDGTRRTIEKMFFTFMTHKGFMASTITRDVTERKSAEIDLRESEARYRSLFEDSPISLWEEDFSAVKQQLDDLGRQGVKDIKTFLKDHPETVAECVGKIKVLDVNNATLKLYRAGSKADILDNFGTIINANTYLTIGDELVAIAEGNTAFEKEVIDHTLTGDEIHIKLSWVTAAGHEDRLSKVIVSKIDITEHWRAEEEIKSLARFPAENPFPVLRLSQDGVFLYANEASQGLLQGLGWTVGSLAPNDLREAVSESFTSQSKRTIEVILGKQIYSVTIAPILTTGYVNLYGRNITERRQAEEAIRRRIAELEAVNRVSIAMRFAQSLDELLPRLMDETLAVLDSDTGMILLYDPASSQLLEGIDRGWFNQLPKGPMRPSEGIAGVVLATGDIHVTHEFASDPLTLDSARQFIPVGWGGACIPIRTANQTIGVLFVSVPLPRTLTPEEVHLLQTIAEIAGTAIHRTQLNDQTTTRLEHLTALRAIDVAISSSFDLHFILKVILDQVMAQLRVDATDILLFNPYLQTLLFAEGRGFRHPGVTHTHLALDEGYASHVVSERVTIHASHPLQIGSSRMVLLEDEGFKSYMGVPLIVKGKVKGVLEIFHRSSLNPDQEWLSYLEALAGQAAIAIDGAELFEGLQRSNIELSLAYDATIEGWSQALDLRDKETEGHSHRVTEITLSLARLLGFDENTIVHIRRGALLHDIGKMGIPDRILLKPGPLDPEEWEIMRKHPVYAYEMLAPIAYLRPALDIPYCHHEKWDGTGYPRGLKGEEIPIEARIFAVVDVWDALNSDRPYRKAWTKKEAIQYIQEEAGKHFDPSIVSIFLRELTGTNEWMRYTSRV